MRKRVAKLQSIDNPVRAIGRTSAVRAARTVLEGRIVAIDGEDTVILQIGDETGDETGNETAGRRVVCRCPMHVDVSWIQAALRLGPVSAEASLAAGAGEGTIWCLLPTPEQRRVVPDEITLAASAKVEIVCGKSRLALTKDGTIRLRGRDVATRGSRIARVQGGVVRVN